LLEKKKSHHHEEQKHTQQKYTILLNQFAQTIQPKLHPKKTNQIRKTINTGHQYPSSKQKSNELQRK